jgi:hypothetical protein
MIKKLAVAGAFALGLMTAGAPLAQDADFVLANATGYPIREVYVSPSKSKNWGDDMLGKHVIENGQAWKLKFPKKASQCVQDIKIVFEDDSSEVVWEEFNLCEIDKITLTYNRRTGETKARTE